ncbi:MAG: hypothetical protein WB760_12730 [Xanthobacteraceae bacterium]
MFDAATSKIFACICYNVTGGLPWGGRILERFFDLINTPIPSSGWNTSVGDRKIGRVLWKKYLLPRPYLVKGEPNKIAFVVKSVGRLHATNMFSIPSFGFSFVPTRDTSRLHLKGRFYG